MPAPPIGLEPLEPRRLFSAAVVNGSFENGLTGWTELGGSNYVVDSTGGVSDGSNSLRLNGQSDIPDGVIAQSIDTVAGQTYAVTFDYRTLGSENNQGQELRFEAVDDEDLIATQDFSVLRGDGFVSYTFSFTATADATELRISDITSVDNAIDLDGVLDNVQISESLFAEPQINNPSFEAEEVGWVFASDTAYDITGARGSTDGSLALVLNNGNAIGSAVLTQTLRTEIGTTYQIDFDYKIFKSTTGLQQELRFEALDADGVLAVTDYVASGSDDFTTRTFTFTATATTTDLRISDITTLINSKNNDGVLDNLTIAAVNRAPVDLSFSPAGDGSVDEGVEVGTLLSRFTTTDTDAGDTHSYTLISGDTDFLQIVDDELLTLDTFTFEDRPTLTAVVRSTDSLGAFIDRTFTVQVNNLNSAPIEIAFSGSEVDENAEAGTLLGQFVTTDTDAGDSHTYTLTSGDTDLLQIVDDELLTLDTFTFADQPTLTAVVRSTDSLGAFIDRTFTVQVNEVVSPFLTVAFNPVVFGAISTSASDRSDRSEVDDATDSAAERSLRTGSTAAATGDPAVDPARDVSSTVSAADLVQSLVQRLAKSASAYPFLPGFISQVPASEPAVAPASVAAAEPGDPEAFLQVQPPAIARASAVGPGPDFNPWLVGVHAGDHRDDAPDPVTAWMAWLEVELPRANDGSPSPWVTPTTRMTGVPTGP